MTRAFVHALQQPTKEGLLKVGATCKHFAGYSLEQCGGISRFEFDAKISARDLQETYLPAFRACVDAEVSSVMCSYNLVNGVGGGGL
jgi:beta-D-xylosidase 4